MTNEQLQAHLKSGALHGRYLRKPSPRIECADGFSLSVQANSLTYCAPRDNNGPYTEVEVGFPSERVEALMPYVENADDPTGTVYGYVPVEIVLAVIAEHGGVK